MSKGNVKVVVVGAGIYGSTIAICLARAGYKVSVFDGLGILNAASSICQLRVHRGYHYPRSAETIKEIADSRPLFENEYKSCFRNRLLSYYAIPHTGSRTSVSQFEKVCGENQLPLLKVEPPWLNFEYIDTCYAVDEDIYDPSLIRQYLGNQYDELKIDFVNSQFDSSSSDSFDFVIYATYGFSGSHMPLFDSVQIQVTEKVLIQLPHELENISLVVIDGPFTGFDPYGVGDKFQFGSARYTTHWRSADPYAPIPKKYASLLNQLEYKKVPFTNFEKMRGDAEKVVPLVEDATYLGSKFTVRLIENSPESDRRVLKIAHDGNRTFHVFSGKVVGAVKAAEEIRQHLNSL